MYNTRINGVELTLPTVARLKELLLDNNKMCMTQMSNGAWLVITLANDDTPSRCASKNMLTVEGRAALYAMFLNSRLVNEAYDLLSKNIYVLFLNDNVLKKGTAKQIRFILGHELAHVCYGDLDNPKFQQSNKWRELNEAIFQTTSFEENRADAVGFKISNASKDDAKTWLVLETSAASQSATIPKFGITRLLFNRQQDFYLNKRFE